LLCRRVLTWELVGAWLRDENGELKFHRTVFEELIPDHFGRLTESHKRGCMCTTYLNGDMLMRDKICGLAKVCKEDTGDTDC
jgi:hypothetical protein